MRAEVTFWVLIAIVLAVSIAFPRIRRAGLTLAGILILTVVAVIAITQRFHSGADQTLIKTPDLPNPSRRVDLDQLQWERLDQRDPAAKTRLPAESVRFDQIRAVQGSQPQTIETVQARLYNDSPEFTLTHYAYYLVIQDCGAGQCTTVYDQRGRAMLDVPPGQARDVAVSIRDPNASQAPPFRLLGTPKIMLTVTETRAVAAR